MWLHRAEGGFRVSTHEWGGRRHKHLVCNRWEGNFENVKINAVRDYCFCPGNQFYKLYLDHLIQCPALSRHLINTYWTTMKDSLLW